MNRLDEILAHKRVEIAARKAALSEATLRAAAAARPPAPDFVSALRTAPIGLIAEIKRRSPSAGPIREPFDPAAIARAYAAGGARAISVLLDEKYFGGGEETFRAARAATPLPLLYKEFVVDAWQLRHARALGASAALLIVAALTDDELRTLYAAAQDAGLTPLVEVHDADELRRAARLGARCIGINNRNLKTLTTRLDTTFELRPLAPPGATIISESGIRTAEDVRRLRAAGVHALLVGEHLLKQPDPAAAVRALLGDAPPDRPPETDHAGKND